MTFVAVLIVYLVIQYGDGGRWLRHDGWFARWSRWVGALSIRTDEISLLTMVLAPVVLLGCVLVLVSTVSDWLLLIVAVPILLYSLGRGELTLHMQAYMAAVQRGDNVAATEVAAALGGEVSAADKWPVLHRIMLAVSGYAGFERLFAVLFWFVLLGPLGALLYRLLALAYGNEENTDTVRLVAARGLWLMEWPAVRVLGLSFALTGNFISCFQNWRTTLTGYNRATSEVLESCVHGALSVQSSDLTRSDITELELNALLPLFSRTMILWLCALAIITIIG